MRGIRVAVLALLGTCFAAAQDWKAATSLPGVDLNGLTPAQQTAALKILREQDCTCQCGMKMAECRVKDPSCSYSNGLSEAVVAALKAGKSEKEAIAAAENSKWAKAEPVKILADPVQIPVAGAPVTGPASAPITIVEFSDFQCPYCAAAIPEINALLKAYPKQVKLVFKQFPLEIHPQADLAAAAAIAANKQGKFWAMHDAMFAHHNDLSRKSILDMAKQNGLNLERFENDIDSTEVRETVVRDVQDGEKAGVEGTPTLFVNGQKYNGPIQLSYLKLVFDKELGRTPAANTPVASNPGGQSR
jgi:protein-disulfide isomerase